MNHLEQCHSKNLNDPIPNSAVLTKSKLTWTHNSKDLSHSERWVFFEETRETTTRESTDPNKRVDQLLKLDCECNVMVTRNEDVTNSVANGTTDTFEHLVFKQNKTCHIMNFNRHCVQAVNAEDIDCALF